MEQERIREINKKLPKMNIKGKEYVMVKDRVNAFREIFPAWSIVTDIVSDDGLTVTIKASVLDEEGHTKATAHAQERYNSTQINKTSALENCETSAIGRAIGLLGIGIDDSFASANEVENAQAQQNAGEKWPEPGDKIGGAEIMKLRALLGDQLDKALAYYHLEGPGDMTYRQYRDCFQRMGATPA